VNNSTPLSVLEGIEGNKPFYLNTDQEITPDYNIIGPHKNIPFSKV
jgi:hypothetical protein